MIKRLILTAVASIAVSFAAAWPAPSLAAQPDPAPERLVRPAPTREALLDEAIENSAELQALRRRIEAAEASVRPAGALPDPMATLSVANVPVGHLELDRTPMSGVDLGLSQRLPAARKRRLRREIVAEQADALRARYEDARNGLTRRVRKAYFDIQRLDEALDIAEDNKALAQDLLQTAEARYATGKGLQQDVFRAQVRLSRMVDALVSLGERRVAAATRLNRLLYRPPAQELPKLPRLEQTVVDLENAGERLEERNPRVREAQVSVQQAEIKERLAAAGARPDVMLGLKYRIRQDVPMDPVRGEDFWSASVGMTLPWVYRHDTVDQEVKAASAAREAAQADLAALLNELAARAEELAVDLGRSTQQIALVETGLLPQAEGALASSRAAYATGRVEFLTVIDNQMNLYSLQLERIRLIAEHERDLAELEYVLGRSLFPASADSEVANHVG
jgi:outer membrane protein TolC